MKVIPLSKGLVALVDDEDYEELSQFEWYATTGSKGKPCFYARRNITTPDGAVHKVYMHRQILRLCRGDRVKADHINHDTLDNQRGNLRKASHRENLRNRCKSSANTSGFKGVSWKDDHHAYSAQIWLEGKPVHLGYFLNPESAGRAYNDRATAEFGEFALLNEVT